MDCGSWVVHGISSTFISQPNQTQKITLQHKMAKTQDLLSVGSALPLTKQLSGTAFAEEFNSTGGGPSARSYTRQMVTGSNGGETKTDRSKAGPTTAQERRWNWDDVVNQKGGYVSFPEFDSK